MNTCALRPVDYELRLIATESATGYFGCIPREDLGFERSLAYARTHPNDEFMRQHLLRMLGKWEGQHLKQCISAVDPQDGFLRVLLWEGCQLRSDSGKWRRHFNIKFLKPLAGLSPKVDLRSHLLKDRGLHQKWIRLFRRNILEHRLLLKPAAVGWPSPFPEKKFCGLLEPRVALKEIHEKSPPLSETSDIKGLTSEDVHTLALARLKEAGVVVGQEMRHTSSLSPVAILRRWQMKTAVRMGRHDFSLSGELTAYGRGMDFEAARAACAMEVVERWSSFASFDARGMVGYAHAPTVVHGRMSGLRADRVEVLDPNDLALEAPYQDEPLYWIEALEQTLQGPRPIFIPAQCVFLFCNLDEIKLFSALGSTGLGSGVDMAGAKLSALTEVIERDSEGTTPFTPERCFEIETHEPRLAGLLESYRQNGIHVQFQDITPPTGLPCCKCFVVGADGRIAKGTGAHLDARRALLAALTETPFPYPGGPPSQPAMDGLLRVPVEALPNYATGMAEQDLQLLEMLVLSNGYRVIYADITRADAGLPVVRAIVPGMELLADFDRFSRVHPRLYANYLRLVGEKSSPLST